MSNIQSQSNASIYVKEESELRLEADEEDKLLLAKSYFDCHEYDRASMILVDSRSARARFLGLYSKFMVPTSIGHKLSQQKPFWLRLVAHEVLGR